MVRRRRAWPYASERETQGGGLRWRCALTLGFVVLPLQGKEMAAAGGGRRSGEDLVYHPRLLDPGELEVEALELVGEALVVDAEEVEHGGVEVVDGDGVPGDVVAEVVGGAPGGAALDAAAGGGSENRSPFRRANFQQVPAQAMGLVAPEPAIEGDQFMIRRDRECRQVGVGPPVAV